MRLEVPNQGGKLRAGMFAEIGFYAGATEATGQEIVVSSDAVQRIGEKTVVFVPREDEPGAFEVRQIEVGGDVEGYTQVKAAWRLAKKSLFGAVSRLKPNCKKARWATTTINSNLYFMFLVY